MSKHTLKRPFLSLAVLSEDIGPSFSATKGRDIVYFSPKRALTDPPQPLPKRASR